METTPTPSGEAVNETSESSHTVTRARSRRNPFLLIIAIILFAVGSSVLFHRNAKVTQVAEAYTLVPEKISESAAISVKLPEDIAFTAFNPAQSIHFSPEIKGHWEESTTIPKDGVYKFLPETKLPVGAYYLTTLESPEIRLEKMFSVDKDPTVLAVFPKQETDVNEYSNITIMFSRPMVALGTLDDMADVVPPVTISPTTEGRWKWITTRTLQFIPTTRLTRASHYTVEVRDGFTSIDGVAIPRFTHTFTTRTLKYQYDGGYYSSSLNVPTISHYEPMRIYFNQPIGLERTRSMITLKDQTGANFAFVAAYGTRSVWNEKTHKNDLLSDHSVLEIYPAHDSTGRKFLWDFNATYLLSLSGAVGSEGDIPLNEPRTISAQTEDIITNVHAESPRSPLVTTLMFDPTGTLTFSMSEPIDLEHSSISGKGIVKVAYGEKCKETENGEGVSANNCEKTDDHNNIVVSFDPSLFGMNETSSVIFTKLQNTDGIVLNTDVITKTFTTYKKFAIISTTPSDGATKASLAEMILCTSVPLSEPSEEDFYKKVRSGGVISTCGCKWVNPFANGSASSVVKERVLSRCCPN